MQLDAAETLDAAERVLYARRGKVGSRHGASSDALRRPVSDVVVRDAEILRSKLQQGREWLASEPARVVVGPCEANLADVPRAYAEFLAVSGGARSGGVDSWSSSGLAANSWVVQDDFDEQGEVLLVPERSERAPEQLGRFDEFLDAVLGGRYREFGANGFIFDPALEPTIRWRIRASPAGIGMTSGEGIHFRFGRSEAE